MSRVPHIVLQCVAVPFLVEGGNVTLWSFHRCWQKWMYRVVTTMNFRVVFLHRWHPQWMYIFIAATLEKTRPLLMQENSSYIGWQQCIDTLTWSGLFWQWDLFLYRVATMKRLDHCTTHCNTLQHAATHCNMLQHTATHCNDEKTRPLHNTLQHNATHCNDQKTRPLDMQQTSSYIGW